MQPEVYHEMAGVQERHWWFSGRRKVLSAVLDRLALPAEARILEIGCGTGGNLAMLAGYGRLQAMECDATARDIATALGICPVHAGGLPGPLPFEAGQFDLVCLLDVLEHIEDDQAALSEVARLIKPTGHLLVTVPAYAWLWSAHDEAHHHHRRYTAGLLRRRATAAGLTVIRLGYFNSLLFPVISIIRFAHKIAGRQSESDAAMPSLPVNRLLAWIFGFERYFVRHALFPAGTSVMVLLTPQR